MRISKMLALGILGGGGSAPPIYLSSEVGGVNATTVAVTFDKAIVAECTDYKLGVTIKVNGVSVAISSATRQTNHAVVYFVIPAVVAGQVVTWEYSSLVGCIEAESGGAPLASVSAKTVTNNVVTPIPWVAQWKENGNGNDSVGANNLTNNGSPSYVTGKIGNAVQLVATNNQYQSIADNAALSGGDVDLYGAVWIYANSLPGSVGNGIISKWNGGGSREYLLYYNHTDFAPNNRLAFLVSANGTAAVPVVAATFGAIGLSTWYFVEFYHDSVNNLIGIAVNGGAFDTAAHSAGIANTAAVFEIGRNSQSNGTCWNGIIDAVCLSKGPGAIPDAARRAALYNAGNGTETLPT